MSAGTCPPDPCEELRKQIIAFMNELKKRASDLILDEGNLPMTKPDTPHPRYGTRSIEGELHQYNGKQQGLRNRLNDFSTKGCGPPPPNAWAWATEPAPRTVSKPIDPTPAVAAVATVGVGYLIYRGIRMIPSIAIPPLWPTIPANAAIP